MASNLIEKFLKQHGFSFLSYFCQGSDLHCFAYCDHRSHHSWCHLGEEQRGRQNIERQSEEFKRGFVNCGQVNHQSSVG